MTSRESSALGVVIATGLRTRLAPGLAAATAIALLAGCATAPDGNGAVTRPETTGTGVPTSAPSSPDLDLALSTPVEDSVYPAVGDPRVDALHYDLDLTWKPARKRLVGKARITFRATRDAARFQLDLAQPLAVRRVRLDGVKVSARHPGKDLVVQAPVRADQRYELVVTYAGRARPVKAPTTRDDFSTTGFTVTRSREVWTMQEPFGAYTWYPVNDQPADKALYDVTVHAPAPWTGISNGRLVSRRTKGGTTTTSWELDEPASSYLMTLGIGDYAHSSNKTASGLRIDYWVPRGLPGAARKVRVAAEATDWVEARLGPYPFSSLGILVTPSQSAMETQTMITLGTNDYVLSPAVITHEIVHQWVGDQVSPSDWRDVWMNEGFTMLMQWMYEADHDGPTLKQSLARARGIDQLLRNAYGPPGAYAPGSFGESNIYFSPALMWNELRVALGEDEFFRIARAWLAAYDNRSATREQLFAHWEAETGRELTTFFEDWVTGPTTPRPGVPG